MSERTFAIGDKGSMSKTITDDDIRAMAHVTGDCNPVHLDEDFAQRTRFKGRIAHGLFCSGLISATLATKLPGPGAIYLSQKLDFKMPVRPLDTLTAEVEVTAWREDKRIMTLSTRCMNQDGKEVATGEAVLLVETVG